MPVTKGPRPTPKPRPKPKKPPTPAARKGGPKKENVGAGRSAYSKGGTPKKKAKGGKDTINPSNKQQVATTLPILPPRRAPRSKRYVGGEMKVLKPN